MHRLILWLALLAGSTSCLPALTVKTAYNRYYEAGEIRPISAYFGSAITGQGFRTVVATQPDRPEGQYFLLQLRDRRDAAAALARITLFAGENREPQTHQWDLSNKDLRRWLYLGLTGSDWPDPKLEPVAWRIEILDAGGNLIAEWKSFLWEMP